MAIVITTALASSTFFAVTGEIPWAPSLWLALGAGLGSFAAGRWSVRKGHATIRAAVVVVCLAVLLRVVLRAIEGAFAP
jgi:uncharacterized membrane protein YfcA